MRQKAWDEYETALLIETCESVMQSKNNTDKDAAIRRLSVALRNRAIKNGDEVDSVFRNENGITLQMLKILYILTNGKAGLEGASSIFVDIVEMKNNHPQEYQSILLEAHKQIEASTQVDVNPNKKNVSITEECSSFSENKTTENNNCTKNSGDDNSDPVITYLKERYSVKYWKTNKTNGNTELLYKVFRRKEETSQSIIRLYMYHSNGVRYYRVETEPEYISKLDFGSIYFENVYSRGESPRIQIILRTTDKLIDSISLICDTIDDYFLGKTVIGISNQVSLTNSNVFDQKHKELNNVDADYTIIRKSSQQESVGFYELDNYRECFSEWMNEDSSYKKHKTSVIIKALDEVSDYCLEQRINDNPLWDIRDKEIVNRLSDSLLNSRYFKKSTKRSFSTYVKALKLYKRFLEDTCVYLREKNKNTDEEDGISHYVATEENNVDSGLESKLYTALSVYCDPYGLSIDHICEIICYYKKTIIMDMLKQAEWAVEVAPGIYTVKNNNSSSCSSYDEEDESKRFQNVLLSRFRNGMSFDTIDYDIFRETYHTLYDSEVSIDDTELEDRLKRVGVVYGNRVFPAEGILDKETHNKLFSYINSSFKRGNKAIYYRALMKEMSDLFVNCYALSDELMLRKYIEFVSKKDEFYFYNEYFTKEQSVCVDLTSEISTCLLSAGKPMTIDEISSILSHIPKDQIKNTLRADKRFVWNSKAEYFHVDIFDISTNESEKISDIISSFIDEDGFAIWTSVWKIIREELPAFVETNLYLSSFGIRNALEIHFVNAYSFNSQVISLPGNSYDMSDIYQLFAKHHMTFSSEQLYALSKELDANIYLYSILEVSVRTSRDSFVSKQNIRFDVEGIDNAIESFMSKDYIRIREIDSFLSFPYVGYEWNEYLLESYILFYSKKFMLVNNGLSMGNVAGAIVKKQGNITDFMDICADVIANSHISLSKSNALDYLADVNMITRRSYKQIDLVLQKAKQIRERLK